MTQEISAREFRSARKVDYYHIHLAISARTSKRLKFTIHVYLYVDLISLCGLQVASLSKSNTPSRSSCQFYLSAIRSGSPLASFTGAALYPSTILHSWSFISTLHFLTASERNHNQVDALPRSRAQQGAKAYLTRSKLPLSTGISQPGCELKGANVFSRLLIHGSEILFDFLASMTLADFLFFRRAFPAFLHFTAKERQSSQTVKNRGR